MAHRRNQQRLLALIVGWAVLHLPTVLYATVIETRGTGAAVTRVDATVNFEDPSVFTVNPYFENGLRVSKTGLALTSGTCGCNGPFYNLFEGNFYEAENYFPEEPDPGDDGNLHYIEIAISGKVFASLEFVLAKSASSVFGAEYAWEALLDGESVATGSGRFVSQGIVIGFASDTGFDALRVLTDLQGDPDYSLTTFDGLTGNYGNFETGVDSIKAQFVPEPSTALLLSMGLAAMSARRRSLTRSEA